MQVYGPYAPTGGRSRWRVQLYCPASKRKKSLTFATRREAEEMVEALSEQLREQLPLGLHDAIGQYLAYKEQSGLSPFTLASLRDRLFRFFPDVALSTVTPRRAEALYLDYTKAQGKFGPIKPATHQAVLRNAKEMWRWLVKRGLCRDNVFAAVEPIGKVSVGKPQLRETEARKLDAHLFAEAGKGDPGALALLVQVYLGLRTSEVLRLVVGDVERGGEKVSIVRGKTRNAKRSLLLYPKVAELLWAYCQGRPEEERVFAANLPQVPRPTWLHKRLHKHCRLAGVPLVCPHSLRGLHSSLALLNGVTSQAVAAQLGHASFSTTARHYADPSALDNARIQAFVQSLHGVPAEVASTVKKLSPAERKAVRQLLEQEE